MRHMTESSEEQFWAQKSVGRPLGEDSKGEKRPRMDGFLAQNGPNVQCFSLDGRKKPQDGAYHFAHVWRILAAI